MCLVVDSVIRIRVWMDVRGEKENTETVHAGGHNLLLHPWAPGEIKQELTISQQLWDGLAQNLIQTFMFMNCDNFDFIKSFDENIWPSAQLPS